jgi:hypothetical protein
MRQQPIAKAVPNVDGKNHSGQGDEQALPGAGQPLLAHEEVK